MLLNTLYFTTLSSVLSFPPFFLFFLSMWNIPFCYHCNPVFYYLFLTYNLLSYHFFFCLYVIWFDCCSPTLLSFSCHLRSLFHHFFPILYASTVNFCFHFVKEYSITLYCCLHLLLFSWDEEPALCLNINESLLSFIFLSCFSPLFFLSSHVNNFNNIYKHMLMYFFVLWKTFMARTSIEQFI